MEKLLVLVLRSCDLLDDITHINKLKTLKVLEISGDSHLVSIPDKLFNGMTNLQSLNLSRLDISGASSLKSMPINLFDGITNLQSLNLSGLQMETLPSFSKLSELRVLILRGCSRLEKLQSLRGLGKLQTLDPSESIMFKIFTDESIEHLDQLRILDLSKTSISKLKLVLPSVGRHTQVIQSNEELCSRPSNLKAV
ncbi:hypothetical protein Dsin_022565 [Dipteronia sinensis]|uniref:Uncharacterized protein n=1 Tax=Dipteronia sinensis TaxID=43782 RepID=A0AAE0DZW2_9ROSI|nr:hypothetical protein Dsin_022565 [Dipteronia sinensis]